MPKVSIIIPVYNVEKYLRECLDSVVSQTLRDIEIICVNDCSTDSSPDILNEYAEKDFRIKILKPEKNSGQGYCRNLAIDNASGEYIMFLDSDDWLALNACELAYNQISKNQNDFVMFPHYEYDNQTEEIKVQNQRIEPFYEYVKLASFNPHEVDKRIFISCYTCTQIYSRKFINSNNIRYTTHKLSEDIAFFVKAFLITKNISIMEIPLYYYRREQFSATKNHLLYKDVVETRKNGFELLKKSEAGENFIKMYIVYSIRTSLNYYNKFTMFCPAVEREFFEKLKGLFIIFDQEVKLKRKDIGATRKYRQYRTILKTDYFVYKTFKNIKNIIFSKEKSSNNITISSFGIKIKYKTNRTKKLKGNKQ